MTFEAEKRNGCWFFYRTDVAERERTHVTSENITGFMNRTFGVDWKRTSGCAYTSKAFAFTSQVYYPQEFRQCPRIRGL